MRVTLADIAASQEAVTTGQAAALALAAADGAAAGLPPLDTIELDGAGRLSFLAPTKPASESERVSQLGELLRRLLSLDDRPGASSPNVPGALLMLIARATHTIDLPPPSLAALKDALRRFGSPDPATLSTVYRQHVRHVRSPAAGSRVAAAVTPRLVRGVALAASLAIGALVVGWALRPGDHGEPGTVPVVHERAIVKVPGPAPAPEPAPVREEPRWPIVTATPLLSASALGDQLFSPSFGANGRDLLFHAGRSRSALLRASFSSGGRPAITTVLQDGAANYHAVQSPDGRWLAFDSDRDGMRGVYIAPSDLRDALQARKISGDGYAAIPRWSPDSRRLAFARADAHRPRVWNVWVAELQTGRLSRVSRHQVGQSWSASWFAGSNRLAYSVEDRLVVVDLAHGTTRTYPSPRPGRHVRTPAVSPDGRWIVFQVYRDGAWLLDVATGRTRRVLDDAAAEEFAWSPDGRRVIYHTSRRGSWSVWQFALSPAT